jgi:hypothetical protein
MNEWEGKEGHEMKKEGRGSTSVNRWQAVNYLKCTTPLMSAEIALLMMLHAARECGLN